MKLKLSEVIALLQVAVEAAKVIQETSGDVEITLEKIEDLAVDPEKLAKLKAGKTN